MSLADGDPCFHVCGKADITDLHRFDADRAQDELAVDRLTDPHVDDRAISGERGDRISRRAERSNVVIRELRRRRWTRRLRRQYGWRRRLNDHRLRGRWRRWGWGRRLL